MPLKEVRQKIDNVDARLLELLNERAELVHEVGEIKRRENGSIYAPDREERLLRSLAERNRAIGGRFPESALRAVYREIMSASYALENGLQIAFLGPPGTYTHEAARLRFGASVEYLALSRIPDVFAAVSKGKADFGVVPIENSTEGAVTYTLDELVETDLHICAQAYLKIDHNLLSLTTRDHIRRIYSHPQSLGQCRQWLRKHFPDAEIIEASSNTRAAELAIEDPEGAAIAGRMAAELYELPIIESSIQDYADNTTRFLVIGHYDCPPSGNDRTSVLLSVRDQSGALFTALEPFKEQGISLKKIESRPSRRKKWEYFFFVDLEGHADDEPLSRALEEVSRRSIFLKKLGSYPRSPEA